MTRRHGVFAILTGLLLLGSAFAHALFGLPAVQNELTAIPVPTETLVGVTVGWLFGSAAMPQT